MPLYVDDLTIWATSGSDSGRQDFLEEVIETVQNYLEAGNLQRAPDKSQLLLLRAGKPIPEEEEGGHPPHVKGWYPRAGGEAGSDTGAFTSSGTAEPSTRSTDSSIQPRKSCAWLYREHRDAFELPEEIFRKQYRLPKVRWLCDELREESEVRRVRTSWTVMTVELQVLCALRFYGTGSFQGMVASDEHVARDQKTVSVAVRAVSVAIVRRLGVQRGWIHFPETPSERFDAEKGFRLLGRIPGVIGCVDGTMVSIVGPSKNDPAVTKAAYWCRKYFYALNVMVVCDADCRIMCIDPRYPGSVHDSFVWQFSWLRNQLEQGQVPRDGRFLLGDSGYPLEPWLITPVPGNHATSTACGRFNKAHSSISAPQHLPCIERARTGVRLRP
ncbi:putative nuclease HARBI1 isoform X1 [Ixodes scapularis]